MAVLLKLIACSTAAHSFTIPPRARAPPLLRQPSARALAPADAVSLAPSLALAGGALDSTADELAGSLFGASLLPWLAML